MDMEQVTSSTNTCMILKSTQSIREVLSSPFLDLCNICILHTSLGVFKKNKIKYKDQIESNQTKHICCLVRLVWSDLYPHTHTLSSFCICYILSLFVTPSLQCEYCQELTVVDHRLPANTALVYHHGKLLALSEADKPCKHI